jgi:hypothetical protein
VEEWEVPLTCGSLLDGAWLTVSTLFSSAYSASSSFSSLKLSAAEKLVKFCDCDANSRLNTRCAMDCARRNGTQAVSIADSVGTASATAMRDGGSNAHTHSLKDAASPLKHRHLRQRRAVADVAGAPRRYHRAQHERRGRHDQQHVAKQCEAALLTRGRVCEDLHSKPT